MCKCTTPIILSQDKLSLHIWYNGQPKLEAWSHYWTPPVLVSLLGIIVILSDYSVPTKRLLELRSMAESPNIHMYVRALFGHARTKKKQKQNSSME